MTLTSKKPVFWRRHWPLLVGVVFWLALFSIELIRLLSMTDGKLIYVSDDVYIHMAIAKNLVTKGMWGVTPVEFASCASSIGWPLLIALVYLVFGVNTWAPLVLNLLVSIAILTLMYLGLRRRKRKDFVCFGILVLSVLFIPFVALTFDGMEHLLQIFLFLAFAERLLRTLKGEFSTRPDFGLMALAAGLTLARYEGLFLAGAAFLLLAWRRQWAQAVGVMMAALLPIMVMAGISLAHGWYPIPNSVLIKSAPFSDQHPESLAMTLTRPLRFLTGRDYMLSMVLVLLALWLFIARDKSRPPSFFQMAPGVFFLTISLAHGTFINIEWFYRHAAYLVALGMWAIESTASPGETFFSIPGGFLNRIPVVILVVLLIYPFLWRATGAILHTPAAARNIFEMQYQMAQFLKRYYPDGPVAVNDIGAVSFYNSFNVLDLYGLASMDVARAKVTGQYDVHTMYALVKKSDARVVIVYDYWFDQYGGIPPEWKKAGEWHFTDCYVCGGDAVSFYAPDPSDAEPLENNLNDFKDLLPVRVNVRLFNSP
jgi:hypothetical protein